MPVTQVLESCARREQNNSLCRATGIISGNMMGELSRFYHQICNLEKDESSCKINSISEEVEFQK